VSEVKAPIDDIWRFLKGPLGSVVLDIRKRPIGKTDFRGRFVAEFQPHDFGARRD
jgi:hypothetical protein